MQLIWDDFLNIIKQEAGTQVVETWFKAVRLERWDKETNTAFLLMPNPFVRKWIQEHYISLIKTHLSRLLHTDSIKLFLFCKTEEKGETKRLIPASALQKQVLADNFRDEGFKKNLPTTYAKKEIIEKKNYKNFPRLFSEKLNPKFTFDSLVVGPSNSLAQAAAIAVSKNLGKVYNPLFIYGPTGLGKTHLLHAVGNEVREKNKNANVLYKTSDSFINEFITSIRNDKIRQFREKYQKVDLLLLDDVQFFSKKEQTQEILFHIFDALHNRNKQVIFSSDTLPNDIAGLQNRLKSRLQSGLVADVQLPTLEMKIAILKKKMLSQNLNIEEEVIKFIASQEVNSIRELEGCLIRIEAFSSLTGKEITIDLANQILGEVNQPKSKTSSSLNKILKTVAKYCSVSIEDIKSKNRNKNIALARQVAFYMLKKETTTSFQAIGDFVGGRNHTTVLHAVTKIETLKSKSKEVTQLLEKINSSLQV
ncbi:chromosomal replication initiator protein DnaA [Candidatus Babeliales bacterium]|nr:chromosomal replication initiator protein DnaA [Candidatus Babeliales bacterium]